MYNKDRMILQSLNLIPQDPSPIEGHWGTAHFTFQDGELNLDGTGELRAPLHDDPDVLSSQVRVINFRVPVQAPQDSHSLFGNCSRLETIRGLDRLDTSQVTNMDRMFYHTGLGRIDISEWDFRNVTDMSYMLADNARLTRIEAGRLNTRSVKDFSYFVHHDPQLRSLNVAGLDVRGATSMRGMFSDNPQLTNIDIAGFQPERLQDACNMFVDDTKLKEIYHLLNLSTEHYKEMEDMFSNDPNLDTVYHIDNDRLYQHSDMSLDGLF